MNIVSDIIGGFESMALVIIVLVVLVVALAGAVLWLI